MQTHDESQWFGSPRKLSIPDFPKISFKTDKDLLFVGVENHGTSGFEGFGLIFSQFQYFNSLFNIKALYVAFDVSVSDLEPFCSNTLGLFETFSFESVIWDTGHDNVLIQNTGNLVFIFSGLNNNCVAVCMEVPND